MKWDCPKDLTLETVVPDGLGGLYLIGRKRTLHRDGKGRIRRICDQGSMAGAVALAGDGRLYLAGEGSIHAVKIGEKPRLVADGFGMIFGLVLDDRGHLIVSDWKKGRVFSIEGKKRRLLAQGLEYPSGLALDRAGNLFIKESGRHTGKDATIRRLDSKGHLTLFATIPTRTRFKRPPAGEKGRK